MIDIKKPTCKIGIGWFLANTDLQVEQFTASTSKYPSSTKAEIFALLTALLVCPKNSQVNIYIDSNNTINRFNKIISNDVLTYTQLLKLPNYEVWLNIKHIVENLLLRVQLHKVKAHSNDKLNDKADMLAKQGTTCQELTINTSTAISLEDNKISIEQPINKY